MSVPFSGDSQWTKAIPAGFLVRSSFEASSSFLPEQSFVHVGFCSGPRCAGPWLGWECELENHLCCGFFKKTKITPTSWLGFPGSKPETRIQMQIVWEGKVG